MNQVVCKFLHLPPTYLQRMDCNPPLLLSVPLSPTFSNFQRLTSFIVRTDNALQPPKNRCKSSQSAYIWHRIDERVHIASFFSAGSCTDRCDLEDMKVFFSLMRQSTLCFTSSLIPSSTPQTSVFLYIFLLLPSLPLPLIQILPLSTHGQNLSVPPSAFIFISFPPLSSLSPFLSLTQKLHLFIISVYMQLLKG